MWVWHTETQSVRCSSPALSLEIVQVDGQLQGWACGDAKVLHNFSDAPKSLGELLVDLDRWLEERALTASGVIGSECRSFLDLPIHWVTDSSLMAEIRGESLVFAMQAGHTEEFPSDRVTNGGLSQPEQKNHVLIDQTVETVNRAVAHGLEVRQKLDVDHLVVSVCFPVAIHADLLSSWLYSVTHVPRGFLMKSHNWELVSCTPERFVSIDDSTLQVQILAGTFKPPTDFDPSRLMAEHQAARNMLRSIVEAVVGKLELTVDSAQLAFDKIVHFQSVFEKPHQSHTSMLSTLAHLTPSPATGTHDRHIQVAVRQLEGRTRGYYGGCFFFRSPGYLESLVSIRSIFHLEHSEVGEMIVGAGLTKESTVNSESAEIISKATSSARLLGVKIGNQ